MVAGDEEARRNRPDEQVFAGDEVRLGLANAGVGG